MDLVTPVTVEGHVMNVSSDVFALLLEDNELLVHGIDDAYIIPVTAFNVETLSKTYSIRSVDMSQADSAVDI